MFLSISKYNQFILILTIRPKSFCETRAPDLPRPTINKQKIIIMKSKIKNYTEFVNENRSDRKALKAAAREWVKASEERRREIKAELAEQGHDMKAFTSAIGDAYDEQW